MIYVLTMYRYGNREAHSYVRYAGNSLPDAISVGMTERDYRGNKYYPEVMEFDKDNDGICVYSELDDMCIIESYLKSLKD